MAKIVVIDAEDTVRSTVIAILKRAGYAVSGTGQFEEALELLRDSGADLVLTNVYLDGIAGHDALKQLKDEFPKLPVLMVSGLPDEKLIRDWVRADGFDVFPKPFTSNALLDKVRQMLPSNANG